MGIEDRDWFREKKLNYDGDAAYESNKSGGRDSFYKAPNLCWSVVLVLLIFSWLGIKVFPVLLPRPHQQAIQVQKVVQTPPSPQDIQNLSPSAPPKVIPSRHESPIASAQAQPESLVIASSADSQTLHYYKKNQTGIKYLTAEINNIPVEVMLDTGASYIALSSDTVKRLGISGFKSKTTTSTAGGNVPAYVFECASVKLGSMTINNVTCSYVPTLSSNLLGNSFLSNFIYAVNEEEETITLIPKNNRTYISNNKIMPVEGSGWAEVDGKKYRYEDGRLKEIPGE